MFIKIKHKSDLKHKKRGSGKTNSTLPSPTLYPTFGHTMYRPSSNAMHYRYDGKYAKNSSRLVSFSMIKYNALAKDRSAPTARPVMHTHQQRISMHVKRCLGRRRFTELDQSLDTNLFTSLAIAYHGVVFGNSPSSCFPRPSCWSSDPRRWRRLRRTAWLGCCWRARSSAGSCLA
jgi:hypothetical protein